MFYILHSQHGYEFPDDRTQTEELHPMMHLIALQELKPQLRGNSFLSRVR